tara:strand:- start:95 stop:460 length:366 start_codon:yes stop_codon:yes gene_type:complete
MSNGRGSKEERNKKFLKRRIEEQILNRPPARKTEDSELDSYNKFVEKVADSLNLGPSGLGKRPPEIFTKAVLRQPPPPKRFKRPTKKPVLDSSGKPVENLVQDMADGGEVLNMSTEMVIDE